MNTKEIELILDGKSHKSTAGQVWCLTKFLTTGLWCTSKFIVKNTPAALGMAWEVKKEISSTIAEEIHEANRVQKQLALEDEILKLKAPEPKIKFDFDQIMKEIEEGHNETKKHFR